MKKIIALLLVLMLCLTAFIACGEADEQSSAEKAESKTEESKEVSAEQSEEQSEAPNITTERFEGETVTFLCLGDGDTYSEILYNEDLDPNSETWLTEGVNTAIAERNQKAEEYLGITINEIMKSSGRVGDSFLSYIRNEISGSEGTFDICVPSIYDCGTLAAEGSFYNLKEIDTIDTTNSWWSASFNESMTINNCLYFTLGDIGVNNFNATPLVYFNKTLAEKVGISSSDLYDLVKSGKWTFDKAYEYAKLLSIDENDDGKIDYNDTVGWAGQADDTWNFFYGSGEKIVTTSGSGELVLSMYNERSVSVAEKMYTMFRDSEHYISANDYFGVSGSPTYECTGNAFIEGRVLFFSDNMAFMHYFSAMDDEFGVLPTPKYNEEQEEYQSLINPWTGDAFAIPVSLSESRARVAAAALDVMGYFSTDTVAREYVQKVLIYQKTRDEESVEMLEKIFATRGCDIGIVYSIGQSSGTSLASMLQNIMKSASGAFASNYQKIANAANKDLESLIALYFDN